MNEAVELLTKLVSIPSPLLHDAKASTYLAGWMNARGMKAYVDEAGNAVGEKGSGPKEILLLGHIDTFPGEVPVRQEGDILYGRGSVDAKGPLCTFAAAAAQTAVPEGWRITVVGAVEEEYATSKGARHILKQRSKSAVGEFPHLSISPSPPVFCIIGEPSNWDRVTLGYKGRLLMDVTLKVPFSHSAGDGRLPAEQGVDLWPQVEDYCHNLNTQLQAKSPFTRLHPPLPRTARPEAGALRPAEENKVCRAPVGITP